jgi:hypothetical protein
MGTSSGLIFFIDSHCIDGSRRSIFLDAIDVVRGPYNSDFVFIKSPPSRPSNRIGLFAELVLQGTRSICRFFVAHRKPWRRTSMTIENSRPDIVGTFTE